MLYITTASLDNIIAVVVILSLLAISCFSGRIPDEPVDRQKAETLVRTSIGSPLYDNECYAILIEETPQYFRLTKKDLNSMFDHSSLSVEDLSNNHFTRQCVLSSICSYYFF